MSTRSISETKRVEYLLGMSSAVERDHIQATYFYDDDAFQEMLSAEDDLVDAYARGELTLEERRRFEKSFASSLSGSDRVQFARAFADLVAVTPPVKSKLPLAMFQPRGLLRIATIAAVIAVVAVLGWLLRDRTRIINELRDLRAESAELSKRTEALQRSSDTERTRSGEIAARLGAVRVAPDKPRPSGLGTMAKQRAQHLPEVKTEREKVATGKPEQPNTITETPADTLGDTFVARRITQLPLEVRDVPNLLTLQAATTRDGYVSEARANQCNITLDGVSSESRDTYMTSAGGASVRGTARDPQGNLVSGATVTLTDPAKNFTRTQSTNKDGSYMFNGIPPGKYSIHVEAPGFKTASISNLAVLVNSPTVLEVPLEIGDVSQTVTINLDTEAVTNTEDATLGSSFVQKGVTQLPLRPHQSNITRNGADAIIRIPSFLSGIKFQLRLETAQIHHEYRIIVKTAEGRYVTAISWIEPLPPNEGIIDTPLISTAALASSDYVLLLMGKEPDGSFIELAEYSFKVIK